MSEAPEPLNVPPVTVPDTVMSSGNLAVLIVPVNADALRLVSEAPEPLNVPPVTVPDTVMSSGNLAVSIVPLN